MIKIGITGSLASGKTTVAKIIANKKNPLFNADNSVKKFYSDKVFKSKFIKKFNLNNSGNFKKQIKNFIIQNKKNLKRIENFIHPFVRKDMLKFIKKNKKCIYVVLEVPLLVENKLMRYFDFIIFVGAKKKIRLNRYKKKGGNKFFFSLLEKRQLNPNKKSKFCDHIIVNNKDINILKKKIKYIIKDIHA